MKKLLLAAVAMTAVSSPAFAATSDNPVVSFEGERRTVCEVRDFDPTIDFGNLSNLGAGSSRSDTLSLFCNVRFDAEVESDNGFLKLDTLVADAQPTSQSDLTAQGYSGFNAAVDYGVTTVVGNANTTQISNDTPVQLASSADPIDATTTITYATIAGTKPLLGGTYEDTLILTITPIAF